MTVGTAGSEEDTTASFRAPLFFGWSTTVVVVVVVDSSSFLQGGGCFCHSPGSLLHSFFLTRFKCLIFGFGFGSHWLIGSPSKCFVMETDFSAIFS